MDKEEVEVLAGRDSQSDRQVQIITREDGVIVHVLKDTRNLKLRARTLELNEEIEKALGEYEDNKKPVLHLVWSGTVAGNYGYPAFGHAILMLVTPRECGHRECYRHVFVWAADYKANDRSTLKKAAEACYPPAAPYFDERTNETTKEKAMHRVMVDAGIWFDDLNIETSIIDGKREADADPYVDFVLDGVEYWVGIESDGIYLGEVHRSDGQKLSAEDEQMLRVLWAPALMGAEAEMAEMVQARWEEYFANNDSMVEAVRIWSDEQCQHFLNGTYTSGNPIYRHVDEPFRDQNIVAVLADKDE